MALSHLFAAVTFNPEVSRQRIFDFASNFNVALNFIKGVNFTKRGFQINSSHPKRAGWGLLLEGSG